MPTLQWLTGDADRRAAARVPFRLLTEQPNLSYGEGDDGLLVQGDNLEALKALLPFYAGRVKCIYIDPPYNTRSAFEHYDDNLEHAQWLGMIVPRLMLLREFLSEEGSIWVSIDDNEGHYLKVVMDEVFGRRNFIDTITWQMIYTRKNSAHYFTGQTEFILPYAKNKNSMLFNVLPRGEEQNKNFKNPDNDPRGRWIDSAVHARNFYSKGNYEVVSPSGKKFTPPQGRYWSVSEENFRRLDSESRIWWGPRGSNAPRKKTFLDEVKQGVVPGNLWTYSDVGHNAQAKDEAKRLFSEGEIFITPKPERLIQRILHIATNPGDLVLDSFLGSGTTAAVAHKMGRRWIGVEMGDHARTHCATRLTKVIDGEQGGISKDVGWQGGGGFRFVTRVYDENGVIAPEVRFADLARHVWFTETRRPLERMPDTPLLGIISPPPPVTEDPEAEAPPPAPDRAVALLFNGILKDRSPQGGNVLTRATLSLIREHLPQGFAGTLTVYASACRLSPATLKAQGVQFRQTPYDLNAGGL